MYPQLDPRLEILKSDLHLWCLGLPAVNIPHLFPFKLMEKDKPCRCATSRMFPHRESKCSMRTNPATSLFNVASQASSGISSFVPSLGTRSTSPMNTSNVRSHPSVRAETNNNNSFPSPSQHERIERTSDYQQTPHSGNHEDDDMTEALLAIALLESQSPQKSGDSQAHFESGSVKHDFHLTTNLNQPVPNHDTEAAATDETLVQHALCDDNLEQPHTAIETERAATPVPEDIQECQPVYAHPCATIDFIALPATPEELQAIEDATNRSSANRAAETSQVVRKRSTQCDCVSSRLFPHRANKCTFRNLTGGAPTEEARNSGADVSVASPLSGGVDNSRNASPLRQHSNSEISSEQVLLTSFFSMLLIHKYELNSLLHIFWLEPFLADNTQNT